MTKAKKESPTQDELERSIDFLGKSMLWAIFTVVVGLIVEYLWEFIPDTEQWLVSLGHKIGGAIVTAGVSGELVIEFAHGKKETALRDINKRQIEEARRARAELESHTSKLQIEVADARERQASAEQLLEWLRNKQRPRLSTFNTVAFIEYLMLRPKGTAEILYLADDGEAYQFARGLKEGLALAGWSVTDPTSLTPSREGGPPALLRTGASGRGVGLLVRQIHNEGEDAYRALANALQICEEWEGRPIGTIPEGLVRIIVGPNT